MAELIKVSCAMADATGFPAFQGCVAAPFPDLLEALPARERGMFHFDVASLAQTIADGIRAVESV
jgi:hypothetical protein